MEIVIAALHRHPFCEFIEYALSLFIHFDLCEPGFLSCDHLFGEIDQLVDVYFDVCMSLDRHLALREVLRLHVELS